MKFCSLVLEIHLPHNFRHTHTDTQTHRQTDRHFPNIVKSCSGHPKMCKSIKNRKSKICLKPILSSACIEESNNENVEYLFSLEWCSYTHPTIYSLRDICLKLMSKKPSFTWALSGPP